jgi:hypothetical protein
MTDFQIVREYLAKRYPDKCYAMEKGNNCVWVIMGMCHMYFIVRDGRIVDIQVD